LLCLYVWFSNLWSENCRSCCFFHLFTSLKWLGPSSLLSVEIIFDLSVVAWHRFFLILFSVEIIFDPRTFLRYISKRFSLLFVCNSWLEMCFLFLNKLIQKGGKRHITCIMWTLKLFLWILQFHVGINWRFLVFRRWFGDIMDSLNWPLYVLGR
jgi:hypothetical protein